MDDKTTAPQQPVSTTPEPVTPPAPAAVPSVVSEPPVAAPTVPATPLESPPPHIDPVMPAPAITPEPAIQMPTVEPPKMPVPEVHPAPAAEPVMPPVMPEPITPVEPIKPVVAPEPLKPIEMPKTEPMPTLKLEDSHTTPPPPSTPSDSVMMSNNGGKKAGSMKSIIAGIAMVVLLLIGLVGGYYGRSYVMKGTTAMSGTPVATLDTLTLPRDAVIIQHCADKKGTLYARPADIPVGPVYMVYNGKVIGIEFMLSKEEFLNGKNYGDLNGLGAKVDHINIGFLSQGHEGYPIPHYHVDLYTVNAGIANSIKCTVPQPGASGSPVATASAAATASALPATASATTK